MLEYCKINCFEKFFYNNMFFNIKLFLNKIKFRLNFFTKMCFFINILIIVYGLYLNNKIINFIDNHIWKFPFYVYGKIISFKSGMQYTQKDFVSILKFHNYTKVSVLDKPGEYLIGKNNIEFIRRSFYLPDFKEKKVHVCFYFFKGKIKNIVDLDNNKNLIYFRLDPNILTVINSLNKEYYLFLPLFCFSNKIIDILIAIEDRNFFYHDGISFFSICRAFIKNFYAGKIIQGASTLTQQLSRNLFLNNKRSFWRKINEIYISIIIDALYSKNYILELYLNKVYFGQFGSHEIRGFPLASIYYFGKPISELSVEQQVLLVAIIRGVSIYNPWKHPDLVMHRRNLILKLILKRNIIHYNDYCKYINSPLNVLSTNKYINMKFISIKELCNKLKINLNKKIDSLSHIRIFTDQNFRSQYFFLIK